MALLTRKSLDINLECNWRYALNLCAEEKHSVGYLLSWSGCGGLTLDADIEAWNPWAGSDQQVVSGERVTCVGVIHQLRYALGPEDPIFMSVFVSPAAAANIQNKVTRAISSLKTKLSFYVLDFHEGKKCWFDAGYIKTGGHQMTAQIDTDDGIAQLFVASESTPLTETIDVHLVEMQMRLVPREGESVELEFASAPETRNVYRWECGDQ